MNTTLLIAKEFINNNLENGLLRLRDGDNVLNSSGFRKSLDPGMPDDKEAIDLIDLYFKNKPKILERIKDEACRNGSGSITVKFEHDIFTVDSLSYVYERKQFNEVVEVEYELEYLSINCD